LIERQVKQTTTQSNQYIQHYKTLYEKEKDKKHEKER